VRLIGIAIAVFVALVCLGQGQGTGGSEKAARLRSAPPFADSAVPHIELLPSLVRHLTMPSLSRWGSPQCDAEGNAYIHAAADVNDAVVVKLALDKDDATVFRWEKSADRTAFAEFSVSPEGDVWFLGMDAQGGLFVVGFNSAGHETTRSRLEVPAYLLPEQFAAVSDRAFLVSGVFQKPASEENRGRRLTAIFDKSGRVVKQLKPDEASVDLQKAAQALPEGAATPGPDGNIYVLHSNRVVVVGPSGETVRSLPFDKPVPEAIAAHLWVTADYEAAVLFYLPDKEHPERLYTQVLVLNALTGVARGYYSVPKTFRGNIVCFAGNEFSLIGSESGRVDLFKAQVK
jgi:hypothetical protein